ADAVSVLNATTFIVKDAGTFAAPDYSDTDVLSVILNDPQVVIKLAEIGSDDTGVKPDIRLLSGKIRDAANNAVATNFNYLATTDGAPPVITAANTVDSNLNGKIDQLNVTFSEVLDDAAIPFDNSEFTIAGYTITSTATGTANDSGLTITLTEGTTYDTDATPSITLLAGKVVDLAANSTSQTYSTVTDLVAPFIKGLTPIDEGVDIAVATGFTIRFDTDVQKGSGNLIVDYNGVPADQIIIDVTNAGVVLDKNVVTFSLASGTSTNSGLDSLINAKNYTITIPNTAFTDLDGNNYPGLAGGGTLNNPWNFTTITDVFNPKIQSIKWLTSGTPINGTTQSENDIRFEITFNEPILATASTNDDLTFYFKNTNDQLFNGDNLLAINTYVNSNLGAGTQYVTFVDGAGSAVTTHTRFVRFDLSSFAPQIPSGSQLSLEIVFGAFEDKATASDGTTPAPNPYLGVNHSNNYYTFTVGEAVVRKPTVTSYELAADANGNFTLNSDLIIDFSEPVNPDATTGNISVYFDSDESVDFYLSAKNGVASNGKTRYTYPLPESLKGANGYHIHIAASAFTDATGNTLDAYDGAGAGFTTISDNASPILEAVSPADNTLTISTAANDLVLTFNEPVVSGTGDGDIIFYYLNGEEFKRVDINTGVSTYTRTVTIDLATLTDAFGRTLRPGQDFYIEIEAGAFQDKESRGIAAYVGGGLIADSKLSYRVADDAKTPYVLATGITSIAPTPGSTAVNETGSLVLEFNEAVAAVSAKKFYVRYASDDVRALQFDVTQGVASRGNTVFTYALSSSLNGQTTLSGNTSYYIEIEAGAFIEKNSTDVYTLASWDGTNVWSKTVWGFTTQNTETTVPAITLSPLDGATAVVPGTTDFVLTFNERVTAQAGNNLTIYYDNGDGVFDGNELIAAQFPATSVTPNNAVDYSGSIFTYSQSGAYFTPLVGNTNYFITIPAGAFKDARGNNSLAINGNADWNFATKAETSAPTILDVAYLPAATSGVVTFDVTGSAGVINNDVTTPDPTQDFYIVLEFNEHITTSTGELFIEYNNGALSTHDEVYRIEAGSGTIDNTFHEKGSVVSYLVPANTLRGNVNYTLGIEGTGSIYAVTATNFTENSFKDLSGNAYAGIDANESTYIFTTATDATAPAIVALTPPDGGVNVSLNQQLVIRFDQPVATATADGSGGQFIEIRYVSSDELALEFDPAQGTPSVSNTVYTYNLTSSLTANTTLEDNTDYYVNISSAAFRDNESSNLPAMTTKSTWNFTTTGTGGTAPAITLFAPLDGSVNFNIRGNIVLTFNQPVYATNKDITISGGPNGNIVINALDDTQVSGSGTTTITLNPANDLHGGKAGILYTVSFPVGTFKDAAGNLYDLTSDAGVDNLTFRTRPALYPDNGAASVAAMVACLDEGYISQQQDILLKESLANDFRSVGGTYSLIFALSSGFEFNTAVAPVISNDNATGDFTALTSSFTDASTLQLNFTADATANALDVIRISGLQFRNTPPVLATSGTIKRTGGTMDAYGLSVSHGTSILNLSVEEVQAPDIATVAPPAGDIQLSNVTFCLAGAYNDIAQDNYDAAGFTLQNSYTDVSVPINYTGANYEYRIYRDEALTNIVNPTGTYVGTAAGAATLGFTDFFKSTDYTALVAGTVSRWVTYVNPNGCESLPTEVVFTIYGLPNAEAIAGFDFDDNQLAVTPLTAYGSVCGNEQVTLGATTNESLELAGYAFYWSGTNITGNALLERDDNPIFNVPVNGGFLAPRTEVYSLNVSNEYGCQDPATATVNVVIDRELQVDIFSLNGITFTESETTPQAIYGDFTLVNEAAPESADNSLIVNYSVEPYPNRTIANGTGYTGIFSGNGLGSSSLSGTDFHKTTFTPSAVGVTGTQIVTYTLTEDYTGCSASVSESIEILADQNTIFTETAFTKTSGIITQCIDDGVFALTETTVPAGFTFVRFQGPGVALNGLNYEINLSTAFSEVPAVDFLIVNADGTKTAT
ncbi:MAG: Ig-like domain-containing protein, partial [Cyclobacteriaceae bacterium]|nr:Ig-like domain-containing protein [Cyclobacteriaceae bacterium]